jgi:Raf kinase inhibitor-like YbhB/YbcL family protein
MRISSPAFEPGDRIPEKYAAEGENVSPPLRWEDSPGGTVSFAVVVDDPDAPQPDPWIHWIVHNIPADVLEFTEDGADTGTEATNSLGNKRYDGPMPPLGHGVHSYRFTVYALDTELELDESAVRFDLAKEMEGHVIDTAELRGTYERAL